MRQDSRVLSHWCSGASRNDAFGSLHNAHDCDSTLDSKDPSSFTVPPDEGRSHSDADICTMSNRVEPLPTSASSHALAPVLVQRNERYCDSKGIENDSCRDENTGEVCFPSCFDALFVAFMITSRFQYSLCACQVSSPNQQERSSALQTSSKAHPTCGPQPKEEDDNDSEACHRSRRGSDG